MNANYIGKLQSSMVTLMFARMRQAAALGRRIEKSRHFSEPAVFVAKVAKRQKNRRHFRVTDSERIRISRISGIIVRLANEKLTYSGINRNYNKILESDWSSAALI